MYKITLEWTEDGRTRSRTISSEDKTKQNKQILIGRDENECDIVFKNENTVSRKHVLIYYDDKLKKLLLKNLTSGKPTPNPIVVDGKIIILEIAILSSGSVIRFGKITMRVAQITLPSAEAEPIYGVRCPNGHVLSYDYVGDFCPYCGFSMQGGDTGIIFPPKK